MPITTTSLENIAGLDVIVKDTNKPGPTTIILHGYGADNKDLAPLCDVLPEPSTGKWYFPNGPLEVPIGPHMMGRAWFPIDMAALEAAMMAGGHRDFSDTAPPQFAEAQVKINALITEIGCKTADLFIGGFSQGAMVATGVALGLDQNVKGLVALSGALVAKDQWQRQMAAHKDLNVFQSHGRQDPVLGFVYAQTLADLFKKNEFQSEFLPFNGGHEIPQSVMNAVTAFFKGLVN